MQLYITMFNNRNMQHRNPSRRNATFHTRIQSEGFRVVFSKNSVSVQPSSAEVLKKTNHP